MPQSATHVNSSQEKLPSELAGAIDKIVGQMEMISTTLDILERRVAASENQITNLSNFIKDYVNQPKV